MKKKVILTIILTSLLLSSVVSAATISIWGKYKGNDIIRIMINGKTVPVSDVPAMSVDGRTMIPLSMLGQIGIAYTWDQKTKTISISSGTVSTNKSVPPAGNIKYPSLYSNNLKVYLGKLTTNATDKDSIFNPYGTYGSKYQTLSIWNEYGTYGGKFSNESAFNEFATAPPAIVLDGAVIGYLTANKYLSNAVTVVALQNWLFDNGY